MFSDQLLNADLFDHRVLHELGGLFNAAGLAFSEARVSAAAMSSILENLLQGRITGRTAKRLLGMVFDGDRRDIARIIDEDDMGIQHLSHKQYLAMATEVVQENRQMAEQIRDKGQHGKIQWFVGRMMLKGEGRVEAEKAKASLYEVLGIEAGVAGQERR